MEQLGPSRGSLWSKLLMEMLTCFRNLLLSCIKKLYLVACKNKWWVYIMVAACVDKQLLQNLGSQSLKFSSVLYPTCR